MSIHFLTMTVKNKKSNLIITGTIARNRKATFNYTIEERIEAGIMLSGSEVKSLRLGLASIGESYAAVEEGDIYLINANIQEYNSGGAFNHLPTRKRKLLLHKKEVNRLIGAVQKKGNTLIPLSLYFNSRGIAKIELGLGIGKKLHDKRQSEKDRDWGRDKARIIRNYNN